MKNDTGVPQELERLILDAFGRAAQDGKAEWYRMRGPVLKNRLLDLTDRTFDESDYGASRFSEFVALLSDMLKADYSVIPFLVELREQFRSRVAVEVMESSKTQIRADLWRAIVDYSCDATWIWDQESGRAAAVRELGDERPGDVLPTADRDTFQTWRAEFAQEHRPTLSDLEAQQVEEWAREGLGTGALPLRLRALWNAVIRKHVHERLLGFFRSREYDQPGDLIVVVKRQNPESELRSFIQRCISLMSEQELKELPIPAEIAMRAHR